MSLLVKPPIAYQSASRDTVTNPGEGKLDASATKAAKRTAGIENERQRVGLLSHRLHDCIVKCLAAQTNYRGRK